MPKKERKPSQTSDVLWLYAFNEKTDKLPIDNCGKWQIFLPLEELDAAWQKIKTATRRGKLGVESKTSTARPSPLAPDPKTKVICVYTYDFQDLEDAARIAWRIWEMGLVKSVLNYKKDSDTELGKYSNRGSKQISPYSISIHHFRKKKTEDEFVSFFKTRYKGTQLLLTQFMKKPKKSAR